MYNDTSGTERLISMSVSPPGLHFQAYYDGLMFKQTNEPGGGMVQNGDELSLYVDDATGVAVHGLKITSKNIRIFDGGFNDPNTLYVGGSVGTRSFLFKTDLDGVGIYLRDPYTKNLKDRAVMFNQKDDGELFIQSGGQSGDIVFRNYNQQVAVLKASNKGQTRFGLTDGSVRSGLDVKAGHIHVSDGYGIQFNQLATKKSAITFDSGKSDRINIHTSNEFNEPNVVVSNLGNVGFNGAYDDDHDLLINQVGNRDAIVQIDTVLGQNPGVLLQSDGVNGASDDGDYLDDGESYLFGLKDDNLSLIEGGETTGLSVAQDGFVGIFDMAPTAALSIGADVVLLNQSGIFMKDSAGVAQPLIELDGDAVKMISTDDIQFIDSSGNIALSVTDTGVAFNRNKLFTAIDDESIGFEVSGSVMVNGDIYNSIGDQIFPLDVSNMDGTKSERTVNLIQINTDSGLSLHGDNVSNKLIVKGQGYYNRIKLPNGEILSSTKNMDLRLVGRGITVTANNYESQGTVSLNDSLKLLNDLVSGGEIKGNLNVKGNFRVINDQIYGNAAGLTNIPFHWQHVTRNNTTIPDKPNVNLDTYSDEGEIYYMLGNVGINTSSPSRLFEVIGTSSIKEMILSEKLLVSDLISTHNLYLEAAKKMQFRSNQNDIVFGRNAPSSDASGFMPWMTFSKDSQWLIGTNQSSYLIDIGQSSSNNDTEFRIESNQGSKIDFNRRLSDVALSLRYDDTGSRFDRSFTSPNVQIEASDSIGFYVKNNIKPISITDDGFIGIFTNQPKNSLDVNGEMSIGYDFKAPENGLIVKQMVGVGMSPDNLPLYPLEVSGSAIIGEPLAEGLPSGVFVNGDGSYRMFIGGDPIGNEKVFFNNHLSIKDGSLSIREGKDPGVEIIRDNTTQKLDQWNQLEDNKGLKINGTKDMSFKTYGGSSWDDELVLDSSARLGIGTTPSEELHVYDNDSDATVKKIKSSTTSSIHLKYSGYQAMIGTNSSGFNIKTSASSFANPELTIVQNKVGINNDAPDNAYKVDVGGTVNASDYVIRDQYTASGFRSFQTVPSGVVIIWLEDAILPGGKNAMAVMVVRTWLGVT